MTKYGKYTVVQELGKGCFGEVYEATYQSTTYAVKKIPITDSKEKKTVEKEVAALSRLRHDNVVNFIESFAKDSHLFIVLEYCNGGDLNSLVLKNPDISNTTLMDYIKQITTGLVYLHDSNVIHRDIKPDNIMITNGRASVTVKLADFGLARIWGTLGNDSLYYKINYGPCGPPFYTAPEVYNEGKALVKSDVFSMGCVIMALFSRTTVKWEKGKKLLAPYVDGSLTEISDATESQKNSFINRYVPLPLQKLVEEMVHDNWRNRPSAQEVLRRVG